MPIELGAASHRTTPQNTFRAPISTSMIRADLIQVLDNTCKVLGASEWSNSAASDDDLDKYAEAIIDKLFKHMQSAPAHATDAAVVAQVAVQLQRLRGELRLARTEEQLRELSAARQGGLMLPSTMPPLELLQHAAAAACEASGLDRAMIFHVHHEGLAVAGTHFVGDNEWADQSLHHAQENTIDLSPGRLETEMVRQRRPALMTSPQDDPNAFRPIVTYIDTPSYVAVPVEVNGNIFATVHVDAYYHNRNVDEVDRDIVASFSEALGRALERSVAVDELRTHRASLRDLLDRSDAALAAATGNPAHSPKPARSNATSDDHLPNRLIDTLTRREMEILHLMATGATNIAIAEHLTVAESTIKSHVKRILRKLRAANRSQAAAIYIRYVDSHTTRPQGES